MNPWSVLLDAVLAVGVCVALRATWRTWRDDRDQERRKQALIREIAKHYPPRESRDK